MADADHARSGGDRRAIGLHDAFDGILLQRELEPVDDNTVKFLPMQPADLTAIVLLIGE